MLGVRMVGILDDQGIFVKKRGLSLVEGHLVLLDVGSSLVGIPFKPQLRHQLHRSYNACAWQALVLVAPRAVRRTPGISCEAPKFTRLRQLHPLVRRPSRCYPAFCRRPGRTPDPDLWSGRPRRRTARMRVTTPARRKHGTGPGSNRTGSYGRSWWDGYEPKSARPSSPAGTLITKAGLTLAARPRPTSQTSPRPGQPSLVLATVQFEEEPSDHARSVGLATRLDEGLREVPRRCMGQLDEQFDDNATRLAGRKLPKVEQPAKETAPIIGSARRVRSQSREPRAVMTIWNSLSLGFSASSCT